MEINGDNDEDELLPDEMSEEELLSVKERVKPIRLIMPCDVSTWWNSTYNMLQFATKYRSALDIMRANHDMNLCKFELSEKEWDSNWAMWGPTDGFYISFSLFLSNLLFIRSSSTELFFFHAMHPTSALMDHIDKYLATAFQNIKLSKAIHVECDKHSCDARNILLKAIEKFKVETKFVNQSGPITLHIVHSLNSW